MTPLEKLYARYVFLCESGDGWWLFGDILEASYWEGVDDPELLALRKEGEKLWFTDPAKHKGGAFRDYDEALLDFRSRVAKRMPR